jgi:DNA-binding transcriptional ArsR family regulator
MQEASQKREIGRLRVIRALLDRPHSSMEEIAVASGVSLGTVRNALQDLVTAGFATSARRRPGGDGRTPGRLEFWLLEPGRGAEDVEADLRARQNTRNPRLTIEPATTSAEPSGLFVIVKAGTNDALLTQDNRLLRVEPRSIEQAMREHADAFPGVHLEAIRLETYYARFYPELGGRLPSEPLA